MARALINVPRRARKGDSIEVKILISHPMESGFARDNVGRLIPRDIVHSFLCSWNGREVMRADLFPAIAANPYFAFFALAEASGPMEFTWKDDQGVVQTERVDITVE